MTLIASPWVVTPRLTWSPIEPIFARADPDAGQALDRRLASHARRLAERGDHRPLQPAHVLVDVVAVAAQVDDRVGDQLAGPVVGDEAAAVGVADFDPLRFVPGGPHRQFLRLRAAPAGVDGRVLEQQQDVADLPRWRRAASRRCSSRASS